ncbi:hypothetical protein AB1N83_005458 [Pleurotus pulmonarius]
MLIRLTPQAPHPTVLFTIAFNNLPETLPSPLSWANQLNCLAADELDVPTSHHCLDKAACIPSLLESITFDLITMTASCSFVDGVSAEWPLFDPVCLKALHGVVNDVSMSALEAERERFREKEEEQQRLLDLMTPPPSPLKPKGHKKQRSLLMTMIASLVPLGRQSLAPTLPTSAPPSPPPSPRPTTSSFASFPPPSQGPDARTLRRRARSTLVDTFRRYILPELTRHFPRAGYYAWIVQSTLRRASMRANALIEKSGGHIPDLARPRRGDWIEFGQDPFLDTTTACTPSSLYDDDDDDTDTDGSSVHTPSSSHFNTMTSTYTSQFASSSQPSTPYNRPPSSHSLPMYTPRPTLSPQEVEEYHILSNLIARLQHLFIAVQSQNTHIENDNAHHEAMLEIRSRRRAWLNRNLVGSARCSSRTIGLSMPFRSSPLAQSSWTCEEYDLVMTPVNLDAFMEDRKLEPDYESRLSEGVSRLRLSDGPKLFPVLEESEGDYEDEQAFVSREFGMEFGVDLEAQRSPQIGESGDMEVGSEGLQVEFDTPHIRPRLRTSSMMAHRRRFDDLPTSDEFPSSPSSSCSSLLSTPPPSPPALMSSPPMQLDSSSLLCQPLKRTSVEMTDSTMTTDLERSQIYSDMDVDMGVYEFGNMKHPQDQEFTLGMDLPLRIPIPVRGRKQQQQLQHIREPRPLPSYGMPTDEDEWDMNSSGLGDSLAVECR